MGPPKFRPPRKTYSELLQRNDIFEYRWNESTQAYYLFNPYTGETIFQTEFELLDRTKSMWAPPDTIPSHIAHTVTLFPEFYRSRSWGRRTFNGWASEEAAATHINSVARGFLARRALSEYFGRRFYTLQCDFSGYLYFHDTFNPDAETTWYKPRLAFPTDIQPYVPNDPEAYMKGDKYSHMSMAKGPIVTRGGLGKSAVKRVKTEAMIKLNPWRDQAISRPEQIDIDACPIGTVIAWMDDDKAMSVRIDHYTTMRAAICGNNWDRVLQVMKAYPDDVLIQLYGYHSFAKSDVRLDIPDDGAAGNIMVDFCVAEVLKRCVKLLRDKSRRSGLLTLKIFAMHAMKSIFSTRYGRVEYFTNHNPMACGGDRVAAREAHVTSRVALYNRYLTKIPMERYNLAVKGSDDFIPMEQPTPRGSYAAELALQCLGYLAEEQDTREMISLVVCDPAITAIKTCNEDAAVMMSGMHLLYNLCYLCESGQNIMLGFDIRTCIKMCYENFFGDSEVMRQCRRLELALKKDGWRGYVESLIEREMRGEKLEAHYLEDVVFEGDEVEVFLRAAKFEAAAALAERAEQMEDEFEEGLLLEGGGGDEEGDNSSSVVDDNSFVKALKAQTAEENEAKAAANVDPDLAVLSPARTAEAKSGAGSGDGDGGASLKRVGSNRRDGKDDKDDVSVDSKSSRDGKPTNGAGAGAGGGASHRSGKIQTAGMGLAGAKAGGGGGGGAGGSSMGGGGTKFAAESKKKTVTMGKAADDEDLSSLDTRDSK